MGEVRMKTTIKQRAHGACPSHARTVVSVRDQVFQIDEPAERGGSNTGPTPTETVLGALIGCTNVIGHKCAKSLGIDIGHLDISAVCDFDRRGVSLAEEVDVPFTRIELTVKADGTATDEELQKVAKEVAKFCPLSKLYRGAGTQIVESWQRAG